MRSEEIRALFEQGGAVLWANLGLGGVVVLTLWSELPHLELLGWLGAVAVMGSVRTWLQHRYRAEQPGDAELPAWGRRFVFGSIVAGLLWGAAAILFFSPHSLLAQGVLTFAIGGMCAAAAGTLACHLQAFFGYFIPALLALFVQALSVGDRVHFGLAAMVLAYAVGMQRVARNNHRAFVRAFQLSIQNGDLLQQLSESQQSLQETNRTLEHRVAERTRALEHQAEALRQAQRLEVAGRLAGGLAHDFNSLLTVIINNANSLKDGQALDEQGRLATEETLEAGRRGAALIRHLLAFSHRKRAAPRLFSLNDLVAEWAELLQRILGEGIATSVSLTPHATLVSADPAQVEQVLVNLVANARSALSGGGRLVISTELANATSANGTAGSYAKLVVQHLGTGGEEDAERPFNPYFSFDADSRRRGLGLSVVWSAAEQWGGHVVVEQNAYSDGAGARYSVFLPLTPDALTPDPNKRQESMPVPRGATILVVDDEPTLRSVMRRSLAREGFNVLVAEDGERALALSRSHPDVIDLLLTDVVMPGLTGIELARKLEQERAGLAILFVSGFTFEEAVPPPDLIGPAAYLPKPFETKVLVEKVRELLLAAERSEKESLRASG